MLFFPKLIERLSLHTYRNFQPPLAQLSRLCRRALPATKEHKLAACSRLADAAAHRTNAMGKHTHMSPAEVALAKKWVAEVALAISLGTNTMFPLLFSPAWLQPLLLQLVCYLFGQSSIKQFGRCSMRIHQQCWNMNIKYCIYMHFQLPLTSKLICFSQKVQFRNDMLVLCS